MFLGHVMLFRECTLHLIVPKVRRALKKGVDQRVELRAWLPHQRDQHGHHCVGRLLAVKQSVAALSCIFECGRRGQSALRKQGAAECLLQAGR